MKTFLQILLVFAFVACLSFEVVAGIPTVSTGYDATAILKAGVRLKSFNNGPGGEIYLGKPDLGVGGNRVEIDFGYTGQWQPSNHVKFEYTPVGTNNLKVTVDANIQYILTYNLGDVDRLNYLQIDVVGRQAETTVEFNNVVLNSNALGNFNGTGGWYTWQVNGLDLSCGFIVEGDLVLSGTQPGGETNKLQLSAGYVSKVPTVVWINPLFTPCGTNDGHTWRYDAFNNIKEGIDSVAAGGTVIVGDGTYNEDVVISKSLNLFSTNGRATTIVNGQIAGWGGGALRINASKVIVGGAGKGFTFNSKTSGGTPLFASYVSGARDSLWIEENKFVAAPRNPGDIETYALLTDGGQTNQTYQNNIFDGMLTPRFLVYINGFADVGVPSTNIDFIGNTFTTLAGGLTLSSSGGEVTGNYFQGTAGIGLNTSSSNVISGNFFQGVGNHLSNHTSSGVDVDAFIAANTFDRRVVIRNAGAYRIETFPWGTFIVVRGNIQGAIDAASAGDSVLVSAGTYNETVRIEKPLILAGAGKTQTIVQPITGLSTGIGHKYDPNMVVAMFVNNTSGVTVKDMTVDGNEIGLNAVVFWNSSSGTLQNLKIMRPMAFSGAQTGHGLAVDATTLGSVSLNVDNCEFEQWNKNAIDIVNGNGTTSNGGNITFSVDGGTFTGRGNTATTAQNCIVVWERGGGTINGSIQNASFADVNYTPTSNEASAILQYGAPNGTISPISGCSFTNTEIYVGEAGGSNHNMLITGNVFDGVDPAYATITQLAAIEDKIIHKMDDNTAGLITFRLKNVVATPNNLGIQQAINAASPGDTVLVAAGTYTENVDVNKQVTLRGAGSGSDPTSNTIVTNSANGRVVLLTASGTSMLSPVLLENLRIVPVGINGLEVTNATTVSYIKLENVFVVGPLPRTVENENGFKIATDGTLMHMIMNNCSFQYCDYGWYFAKHGDWGPGGSNVVDVTVTNTTFLNNDYKGIYVEKLSDAIFTNVVFSNNGSGSFWNDAWNGGADINLKGQELYQNLVFNNPTITNNGLGFKEGAGMMIKARGTGADDGGGGAYALHPATLNNVTINGGMFTGNERGVRFGEPGKGNTTPTNVTIHNATISGNNKTYPGIDGSAYGGVVNMTTAMTDAMRNWWGHASGPADPKTLPNTPNYNNPTGLGDSATSYVDYKPWYINPSMDSLSTDTIWASTVGSGTILPAGTIIVNYGGNQTFTIAPALGHHIDSVVVDGVNQGAISSYPFTNVTSNHTIIAYFSINTFTIAASKIGNGTITPSGSVSVNYGGNQTFTIAPALEHHIDSVVVDGVNQGAIPSYPFTNVTSNHTIIAYFSINTFTIDASKIGNGTIAPSGSVSVNYGGNQTFTIASALGHHIDSVVVDGVNQGAISSYPFTNVTSNHTITAYFSINIYTLNLTIAGSGTVGKLPDKTSFSHGESVELTAIPLNLSWLFSAWDGDIHSSTNPINITMDSDKNITAIFVRDSAYLVMYRSFMPESIALDRNNRGVLNKYVKKIPDKVEFSAKFPNPTDQRISYMRIHFRVPVYYNNPRFPLLIDPPPTTIMPKASNRWLDLTWTNGVSPDSVVSVSGWGREGKLQGAVYYCRRSNSPIEIVKPAAFDVNKLYLPVPNRVNALIETIYGYGINGLIVGKDRKSGSRDSSRYYGWFQTLKYSDVLKTLLIKQTMQMHSQTARGFDNYINGRPITGKQKIIKPTKHNNVLLADMIALRTSITASAMGVTPRGFGELIYSDGTSNPLNGLMVKEIAAFGDSIMMGQYDKDLRKKVFSASSVFTNLSQTIQQINRAFEGPVDTIHFFDSLILKGCKPLIDVPYLRANPGIIPEVIIPQEIIDQEIPVGFALYQNYPNPFNPTTTISFDLPEEVLVTLKIYNILGQEVSTLLERELLSEGTQEIMFDADGLASGVYFYSIITEAVADDEEGNLEIQGQSFVNVKKMILMK